MAVLSGRDRGQLLLLGAIVIGFVIVTLSLTLNGGLYAETMAGEAVGDVSETDTRYLLEDVRGDTAWIITREPAAHPPGEGAQTNYVQRNLTVLNEQYRQYYAHNDAVVDVSVASVESGSLYTGNLEGSHPRFPITNVRARNVTLTVTGNTGTTALEFDGTTDSYTVRMGDSVEVDGYSDSTPECPVSDPDDYTVNVSAATVDGEPCPALEFGDELDGSYTVRFVQDNRAGSYAMIANKTSGGDNVIYAAYIDVTHRTTTADYEGTIRVAPGEI